MHDVVVRAKSVRFDTMLNYVLRPLILLVCAVFICASVHHYITSMAQQSEQKHPYKEHELLKRVGTAAWPNLLHSQTSSASLRNHEPANRGINAGDPVQSVRMDARLASAQNRHSSIML